MSQWNDLWDAWDIRAARYCFGLCLKMRNLPPVMAILQATWGFKLAISLGKHDAIFTSRKVDMVLWFQSLLGIWYDPYIYIYIYVYIYMYIYIYVYIYNDEYRIISIFISGTVVLDFEPRCGFQQSVTQFVGLFESVWSVLIAIRQCNH